MGADGAVRVGGRWLVLVVLALACSAGCRSTPSAEATAAAEALAREGVQMAIDSLGAASERADVEAILGYLDEDYVLRRAEGVVRGREAMRPIWEGNFSGWVYVDSRMSVERFSAAGSLAVASGMVGGLLRPKDRPATAPPDTFDLPYLAAWRRLENGRWVLRDLAVIYPPS